MLTNQNAQLLFPFNEITVVWGDPSKPSADKLNGQWNPEDFATRGNWFFLKKKFHYRFIACFCREIEDCFGTIAVVGFVSQQS
jgi:predicted neuraminidase